MQASKMMSACVPVGIFWHHGFLLGERKGRGWIDVSKRAWRMCELGKGCA
jgi:hypothetical protein